MYAYIYMYMYIYMYIYTYKIHTHTHKHTHTGLGFCIAGGLQKLEHLTAAERQAVVAKARSAAGKLGAGGKACERAARALGILDAAGNGDVFAYCKAGGLARLEHLSLQERLEAAEEAKRTNSAAGNRAKQETQQVCDLTAHLIQTMDF
jgi:hypothetical protein